METVSKKVRLFEGEVVSDKQQKTIIVIVRRTVMHPKYKKRYQLSHRYKVHDEEGAYHVGDRVCFVECRPMSKDKRWRVIGKV